MMSNNHDNLRIVNATWYMPNDPRNCKEEHMQARLTPETLFFDIDGVVKPDSNLPHTMPGLDVWKAAMLQMRLVPSHDIVCYDT